MLSFHCVILRQSRRLSIFSVIIFFLDKAVFLFAHAFVIHTAPLLSPQHNQSIKLRCCPGCVASECVYIANRSKQSLARPHRYITGGEEPTSRASTTEKTRWCKSLFAVMINVSTEHEVISILFLTQWCCDNTSRPQHAFSSQPPFK